jgi:hypothetical protein
VHQDGIAGFSAFNEERACERIAGFGMAHVAVQVTAARIERLGDHNLARFNAAKDGIGVRKSAVLTVGNNGLSDQRCRQKQSYCDGEAVHMEREYTTWACSAARSSFQPHLMIRSAEFFAADRSQSSKFSTLTLWAVGRPPNLHNQDRGVKIY